LPPGAMLAVPAGLPAVTVPHRFPQCFKGGDGRLHSR
jgi:hypothetical protein